MPILVIRNPDGTEEERAFEAELTIGRAESNDLVLSTGGVSRKHARVFVDGAQVKVEDAGSANGTYVDGARLEGAKVLAPSNTIQIGDHTLSLKPTVARPRSGARPPVARGAAPPTRALAKGERPRTDAALLAKKDRPAPRAMVRGTEREAAAGPRLRGLTGPWANQVYPIDGLVEVGRVAGVTLLLDDDSVSRRHAELEPTPEGVVLRDLGSANGTAVNGLPVTEEVLLQPGDVVQFGVVELEFQDRAVPRRAGGGRADEKGAMPRSRKLLIGVAAGIAVLFAAGLVLKLTQGAPSARAQAIPSLEEQQAQVVALLSECRSFIATELGATPSWDKAEAACNKALDLDPIHKEANELIRKIKFEQEMARFHDDAERAMRLDRQEEALEAYAKITEGSLYYLRVKPRIRDAVDATMRKAKDDCDRYVRNGELRPALERCEKYMEFRCQDMRRDELHPPPGYRLVTSDSGRLRRNEWRPSDPMYRKFLRVRAKVDPGARGWECPTMSIIRPAEKEADPAQLALAELQKRFGDKGLQQALLAYWMGRDNEANRAFLMVQEDMSRAALHRQAEELRQDAAAVASLFKAGQTALQRDDLPGAADAFREAVQLDEKLLGEMARTRPSEWRRMIGSDFAEKAYARGKLWADRADFKQACGIWKEGFWFYKGNAQLMKAIGFCSTQALQRFQAASSCADLPDVLAFAVEGDGVAEQVSEKKTEWGCR